MNFASRIYPNPMKNPEIGINLAIPMTQIQTNPEICINVAINLHQSSKVKKEPSKISHKSPQIFINPDTSHIIPWFFPISARQDLDLSLTGCDLLALPQGSQQAPRLMFTMLISWDFYKGNSWGYDGTCLMFFFFFFIYGNLDGFFYQYFYMGI